MSSYNLPWPTNNDKAFKEGLTLNPNVASLDNWVKYSGCELFLPNAYKEAADIIICHIENGELKTHPDMYFFPIAYLYRHAFELSLKQLVQMGVELEILVLNPKLEKILREHNLYSLWNNVRKVLKEVWPDGPTEDLKNVERLIQEFHNFDESGQNFRYSKNVNGNYTTEKLPSSVDLSVLKKASNNLFGFLEACKMGLNHCIDWQHDMECGGEYEY